MGPPSQIIRGETVVHSLVDKESLQMHPPSQINTRGNCRILFS